MAETRTKLHYLIQHRQF